MRPLRIAYFTSSAQTSAQRSLILGAAVTIGLVDAALIATGVGDARGSFQYVPLRLWLVAHLCWAVIAGVVSVWRFRP